LHFTLKAKGINISIQKNKDKAAGMKIWLSV